METYGMLRGLADSWGLLAMFVLFLGIVFFAFRPGGRKAQDEAARSIFENETKPKDDANGR
jgi:cytochrome c oxidase cbb3-type subunit 4